MRKIFAPIVILVLLTFLLLAGCEKETIITTTETIREIEYVAVPGDTVLITVPRDAQGTDTVIIYDTTFQTIRDTVFVTDTVDYMSCVPGEQFAFAALQYYSDPLVITLVNQEFGLTGGWIYYLSQFQSDLSFVSAGTYDIYGYIDYWMTDWSGYYQLEYLWRLTYTSGDPSDPTNWQMSAPYVVSGREPGMRLIQNGDRAR